MVHRVAALDKDSCVSRKCGLECIKFCPVNKTGSDCIILGEDAKAVISEELCTGCGICIKKCPFEAITIVNLAEELLEEKIHQYGVNTFRLYRLPIPRAGGVVGLVGRNGVGKTTALNILSGTLKLNLGRYEKPPEWDEIIGAFQGTEMKQHFQKIASGELKVSVKPQQVHLIQKAWGKDALSLLKKFDERNVVNDMVTGLNLDTCIDKSVADLSGGELQRLAVAVAASREAELYLFDEPSSYNDVYQRLAVSKIIRGLSEQGKKVVVVEHDLTFLDYLSDYLYLLYGEPGAYGILSTLQAARTGINILLDGYLPSENVRFRDAPVVFDTTAPVEEQLLEEYVVRYQEFSKIYPGFSLSVETGGLRRGEVIGILGANALGKTTFMKIIAGVEKPSAGSAETLLTISYKPQYLSADFEGSVRDLLSKTSGGQFESGAYESQIIRPLGVHRLYDKSVQELSGGELQKVAISASLSRDADIYALDEPSAFIDIEDRIILAKAVQRFVRAQGRSAFIVDHDVQLVDIVADRLIIFSGKPGVKGHATPPLNKLEGMNSFLKELGITYRRDVDSGRPRVNKPGSKLDRHQKTIEQFYYVRVAADEESGE
ncbi:MAG: ribosome biogenesis/translation initiation ATPase RLI [Thaumarchaeota archaeon]|nr:ribosome biogenesis/translation initiation ATPase RLI [Nitrososphaerota archaeon]